MFQKKMYWKIDILCEHLRGGDIDVIPTDAGPVACTVKLPNVRVEYVVTTRMYVV